MRMCVSGLEPDAGASMVEDLLSPAVSALAWSAGRRRRGYSGTSPTIDYGSAQPDIQRRQLLVLI